LGAMTSIFFTSKDFCISANAVNVDTVLPSPMSTHSAQFRFDLMKSIA